jgi:hypothetical protein
LTFLYARDLCWAGTDNVETVGSHLVGYDVERWTRQVLFAIRQQTRR